MPLYGKIVVIRRGGMDGTEFPLTAACLFGRHHGCDVCIKIPLVSKEHCRVEINENKEVVLTNLSSVNPTCINGVPVRQSERLKHGDVFTILDRSFRFEAPPPPTPKKKVSTPGKVLQQQPVQAETGRSNSASDSCHEDGSKIDNSMDQRAEAAKEMVTMETTKPSKDAHSPFHELCQIAKQELDPKSSWKTHQSKLNLQKPATPKASEQETSLAVEVKGSPEKMKAALPVAPAGKEKASVVTTSKSTTKKRRSSAGQPVKKLEPAPEDVALCPTAEKAAVEETPGQVLASATPDPWGEKTLLQSLKSPKTSESQSSAATSALQKKDQPQTPQKLSVMEVIQQIVPDLQSVKKPSETPKSPKRRSTSQKTDPAQPEVTGEAHSGPAEAPQEVKPSPRTSPRANAGQRFKVQDVPRTYGDNKQQSSEKCKSGGPDVAISTPLCKKKRVSFGDPLRLELFDKRLPPNCPLCRGATPARLSQTPKSLLKRVTISHIQSVEKPSETPKSPKRRSTSPKTDPAQPEVTGEAHNGPAEAPQEVKPSPRTSPRANAGQRFKVQDVPRTCGDNKPQSSKKRKSRGPDVVIPTPPCKKKRVSFGDPMSPELVDKRLPPNCPLRRGATPAQRCLGLSQTPKSLSKRVTVGHLQSGPWASPRKQLDLITPSPKQLFFCQKEQRKRRKIPWKKYHDMLCQAMMALQLAA